MAVKTVKGEDGHSYVRVSPSKANKIMYDVQLYYKVQPACGHFVNAFTEFASPTRLRDSWVRGSGPLRGEYWIRVSTDKPEYTPNE